MSQPSSDPKSDTPVIELKKTGSVAIQVSSVLPNSSLSADEKLPHSGNLDQLRKQMGKPDQSLSNAQTVAPAIRSTGKQGLDEIVSPIAININPKPIRFEDIGVAPQNSSSINDISRTFYQFTVPGEPAEGGPVKNFLSENAKQTVEAAKGGDTSGRLRTGMVNPNMRVYWDQAEKLTEGNGPGLR